MNRKETAKTFMFVCFGLAALAGAVQFVAPDAVAQSVEPTTVAAAFSYAEPLEGSGPYSRAVIMSNGDIYTSRNANNFVWAFETNIFTEAGALPLSGASMGEVKQLFSK